MDLGWYDYGFRDYDPQIGRFVQIDPLANNFVWSPYVYSGNDPIANIDVDGLGPENIVGEAHELANVTVKATQTIHELANVTVTALRKVGASANTLAKVKNTFTLLERLVNTISKTKTVPIGAKKLAITAVVMKGIDARKAAEDNETAELYILNNPVLAMGGGHLAAAVVTKKGVFYISDNGADVKNDPNANLIEGKPDVAFYRPHSGSGDLDDDLNGIVTGKDGEDLHMSNKKEGLEWIDQQYSKKFSIKISGKEANTFLRKVYESAKTSNYNMITHNCADAILDGLHSIGRSRGTFPVNIPNQTFEEIKCDLLGKDCLKILPPGVN
jgi:uncharacterized protein RhaS with RHS repeats